MYIDTAKTKLKNGKTYTRHLLRTSYWEDGKTKHKTIGNLTSCTPEELEAIRFALRHKQELKSLESVDEAVTIKQGKSVGAVWMIYKIAKRLGIEKGLGRTEDGKRALWQVIARVIDQGSRLSAVRLATEHECGGILGVSGFNEEGLYRNLDWLNKNQPAIEDRLFSSRHKEKKTQLFLYDVTSSYLEGECNELAEWGYNRDKKQGKKQIVIGLLCDEGGVPVSVEVFRGNTRDLSTFGAQVKKVSERFGCERVTMVGDRGMIKSAQVEDLKRAGFYYITAITKPEIEGLIKNKVIQLDVFDEELTEAFDEEIRYVIRRNPQRAKDMEMKRNKKRESMERFVAAKNRYLTEHKRAKAEVALRVVQAKIRRLWVSSWLKVRLEGRELFLELDAEALLHESRFDGCYVLKTDLAVAFASKEVIHERYKDLAVVDQAFRVIKTGHLEVRPVYVRLEERTRAHVFVVMLSYMIVKELKKCWKDLNLTVAEGIANLSSLCCDMLIINGGIRCLRVPDPRDSLKALFWAADVDFPDVLPSKGYSIDTKKKLKKGI